MTSRTQNDFDYSFKVLILGDISVGKTKLAARFCDNNYTPSYKTTIGIDFTEKIIEVDNVRVRLQVWDTAGQERYRTLTSSFYRGSMGVLLLYDITVTASFHSLLPWLENIREFSCPDISIIVVGSKCDLAHLRAVNERSASQFASEHDLMHFIASAKTGENAEEIFHSLTRKMLKAKYSRRKSVNEAITYTVDQPSTKESKCPPQCHI